MNILLINTLYNGGGAEKTVRQIMNGLKKSGNNVFLVVYKYTGQNDRIISLYDSKFKKMYNYVVTKWHANENKSIKHSLRVIKRIIEKEKIDIVHFHNVHGNYLGINDIKEISNICDSIIWTLHDSWVITGHCASPDDCFGWIEGCKTCYHLEKTPPIRKDCAEALLMAKRSSFLNSSIFFVTPSVWLYNNLKKSYLSNENMQIINNGVNPFTSNVQKSQIRQKYGIKQDAKCVLCSSANLSNYIKGIQYFVDAMNFIDSKESIDIILVGNNTSEIRKRLDCSFSIYEIGFVNDEQIMYEIYYMSDVYAFPSLLENYSYSLLEAVACGTPVVGFDAGGNSEIVNDERGVLVEARNYKKMSEAILYLLGNDEIRRKMSQKCIEFSKNHTEQQMVDAYYRTYVKVLNEKKKFNSKCIN